MPIYKLIVGAGTVVRRSHTSIQVVQATSNWTSVAFPRDVRRAYVQASNLFPGDRVTLGALTVWWTEAEPRVLQVERQQAAGPTHWFSLSVET